ncbi:transposase [Thalassotalea sp. PS06]|uniref:transposase n=1 Tax=Thalassotalea sp. PS06 TaxID=2594005 RepID=UPI001163148A|nr:transposase [Thalassotalea sp. PS06]QDP01095.1 transposase [Thalassotalea sp. PS06]
MPTPRCQQISLHATPYYHCVSRCVRRAFLCGWDHYSKKNFDHRREWIEQRLLFLAQVFCIDVCAYAVMSNHCHVVLHIDKEKALTLSDIEVVERWHKVCKGTLITKEFVSAGTVREFIQPTLANTVKVYRKRLFDISWFMRLLNEPIARMANEEDECTGKFWESRFRSQALLDDAALAACMAYVDLNPIRAGKADTLQESIHTSIHLRVKAAISRKQPDSLMKFSEGDDNEKLNYLPFRVNDYLELVDMTGRAIKDNCSGFIQDYQNSILSQVNLNENSWLILVTKLEYYFSGAIGQCQSISEFCGIIDKHRRTHFHISKRLFG